MLDKENTLHSRAALHSWYLAEGTRLGGNDASSSGNGHCLVITQAARDWQAPLSNGRAGTPWQKAGKTMPCGPRASGGGTAVVADNVAVGVTDSP
eukprot:CAMPEP_0202415026 /NCGR_PEP_ID=MMETSP1128-20130828/34793_1 /ASSEMBLY_ACC=CAM_ASM_000463 /TAXON_ID=3047 /ORGANISM="Dunaliella tertiolecta, Strain CCMP1320" /LENGTH=94 /DNA_ID=CAMNT_0049021601 /DNA_START=12 /DNA_END=292 /DNA_ORIENTATION=+